MARFRLTLSTLAVLLAASSLSAEVFTVRLGNTQLGSLTYTKNGNDQALQSVLSNTPLGVFNGTFKATSNRIAGPNGGKAQRFIGVSKSSRKQRTIATVIAQGRALKTDVTPEKERTSLSDVAKVPDGVVDPVIAIGHLLSAQKCPSPIRIYDGRRAIQLSPQSSEQAGDSLTCSINYTVVAGPGHLSPLKISSARMKVIYDTSSGRPDLRQIQLRSGIFKLHLDRQD